MKTFHEVVDEIYYKVDHLEPWERGTRKTAGMSKFMISHNKYFDKLHRGGGGLIEEMNEDKIDI